MPNSRWRGSKRYLLRTFSGLSIRPYKTTFPPKVREPKAYVPYPPEDLGMPFPEVRYIYVGGCIARERWEGESAHAHADVRDPFSGVICVRKDWLLWAKHSWRPRDIMWHEYAHILHGIQDPERNDEPHGPEFKRICAEVLHKPEVGRTVV